MASGSLICVAKLNYLSNHISSIPLSCAFLLTPLFLSRKTLHNSHPNAMSIAAIRKTEIARIETPFHGLQYIVKEGLHDMRKEINSNKESLGGRSIFLTFKQEGILYGSV